MIPNQPIKKPRRPVQLTTETLIRVRGGLISEVGFPACDGAAKDPARR